MRESNHSFRPGLTAEAGDKHNLEDGVVGRREMERHWPLINLEESRFIENVGGVFRGYVESESGNQEFEDVRISRVAYYDNARREIAETFIATEAVNDEGGDELQGPSDVRGFTILVERRSRSGDKLGDPDIISLQPRDFDGHRVTTQELHRLASEVHDLLAQLAPSTEPTQLRKRVEARLQKAGWRAGQRTH